MGELFGWLIVLGIVVGAIVVLYVLIDLAKAVLAALFQKPGPSRYDILNERGREVTGVIIRSERVWSEDADVGLKVAIRFVAYDGQEQIIEDARYVHWPDDPQWWQAWEDCRQVGRNVTIRYDPEDETNYVVKYEHDPV